MTPHGTVTIKKGSIALISSDDKSLAVFNILDEQKGAITIQSDDRHISLTPGRHVTITRHAGAFAHVNHFASIPHRNLLSETMANGTNLHASEFSMPSAFNTVVPLNCLVTASSPHAKKMMAKLMKTMAVVMHLGTGGGEYRHHYVPELTAMAD